NRCPASINSFDENWPVVAGGGEGATPGGGWGASVPVVWAIASVDATAIRLAIAATRELGIMAAPRKPSNSRRRDDQVSDETADARPTDQLNVRFTPESGHRPSTLGCPLCAKSRHPPTLFNNLINAGKERSRHCEAERLSGLQVDHQHVFCRAL